jgi:hypothetical protein
MKRSQSRPATLEASTHPWRWALFGLALALIAGILILFPFDWLEGAWPAYSRLFDVIFATAAAHMIGHATIFFIAGLLLLAALRVLREQPVRYLALMLAGALTQEGVQSLFKRELPALGDARDLPLDLAGFTLAYSVVWLGSRRWLLSVNHSADGGAAK